MFCRIIVDEIENLPLNQKMELKATGIENILFPCTIDAVDNLTYPVKVCCFESWSNIFDNFFDWGISPGECWPFGRNETQILTFVDIWQLKREGNYENQIIFKDI